MKIIPAVDIKEGKCVRLKQGIASAKTIFSDKPEEMAKRWYELGAERIHIVDLDGAFSGKPINFDIIEKIVKSVPAEIEVGGGIRNIETIKRYISIGVKYVILGTIAIKSPDVLIEATQRYPKKIILGIDAKDGRVAVEGWIKGSELTPIEIAKRFENYEIASIIYTDIKRDGMKTGPNIEATKKLASSTNIPIIASGGVATIEDIKKIIDLSSYGIEGIIIGRALYDGDIDLKEAIKIARKECRKDVHSK